MRSWNHRVIKGQWRHMPRKWFYEFWPIKIIHGHSKTIVTCSTRRKEHDGRWNFYSSSIRSEVSGDHGFSSLFGTWPDLRGHWLTWDLKFIYQSRLPASYTLVFFREAMLNQERNGKGGGVIPIPQPLVPWKDAKWPVPVRVKNCVSKTVFRKSLYLVKSVEHDDHVNGTWFMHTAQSVKTSFSFPACV